jgi:uncharacterized protein involved in exopolysaccharide biosynthesis
MSPSPDRTPASGSWAVSAGNEAALVAVDEAPALAHRGREPSEYLDILRRHMLQIVLVTMLLSAMALLVAVVLPPVYRSSATILVQEQEVPPDLVRSTITSFADERIQVISQQVMTRQVLLDLVKRHDLYPELRRRATTDEVIDRLRRDIRLTMVDSSISDRASGRRVNATIAFKLSFDSSQPEEARRVVDELVHLYLNENVQARQQSASETAAFLSQEAKRAADRIRQIEVSLADFKRRYAGRTPDSSAVNLQLSERTDGELRRVEREIALLQDRRAALEVQLTYIEPRLPPPAVPGIPETRGLAPADRLRALEAQYAATAATYRADHPDLRRMEREIALLRSEIGGISSDGTPGTLEKLEDELASLRKRYSEDHPDVQRLKRSIAALAASGVPRSAAPVKAAPAPVDAPKPDNPAYLALVTQIESAKREATHLAALRDDLRTKQRAYDSRLLQIPEVEREYRELTRDYDNAQERYRDIRAKEMQATVALELERDQKAERFSIGEPANLPETPISPKRMQIVLLGLIGSLGGSIALAWLRDVINPAVKGPLELDRISTVPVLAPIPYIETRQERNARTRNAWLAATALLLVGASALVALDRWWKPLPAIVESLVRRLPF